MKNNKGSAVILAVIMSAFLSAGVAGYLSLVVSEYRIINRQADLVEAFYLAEAGTQYGEWLLQNNTITTRTTFRYPYNASVNITIDPDDPANPNDGDAGDDLYTILGNGQKSSRSGVVTQNVETTAEKNPPSRVFDYVYFINNWGWFYGRGITAKGDVRSNGIFSFREGPRVDGHIYAGNIIDMDSSGLQGAGQQQGHQHPNSKNLPMPNLMNLSHYQGLAGERTGYIRKGDQVLVDRVYGDDGSETGNIVLIGTPSEPIVINGPVVVTGDVIIKGTVRGQGTIYAGRNIYLASDIRYGNAPPRPRPVDDDLSTVDEWVRANQDKDVVGFAARENIIMGDYTARDWYSNYWLFNMGDEDVGMDGIPDTRDTGEGDGRWDPQYEDLDGDNVRDYNYGWGSVRLQTSLSNYANLPRGVTRYSQLATNTINRMDGVYYTNHAFAGRTGYGVQFNGSIISRDEAIIYRNTLQMNYDERIHSRYRRDPNWLINLNLPVADEVDVLLWEQK